MVTFWPWRGDDSSPASFEKALSALSVKITDSQTRLERVRATSRRVRVLTTLYLSFAYLIYAIVLLLVVGYQNLKPWEWVGVGGGPVIIYTTRTIATFYYNFRIEGLSTQLKQYQDERTKTIKKLKDATKYDSTQELLEKYGGNEGKSTPGKKKTGNEQGDGKGTESHGKQHKQERGGQLRTNMPPPPTANIPRPASASAPRTPQPGNSSQFFAPPAPSGLEPSAEFAPNAFPHPPPQQYTSGPIAESSHWYDRIMDLLLGEDEAAAKNRIVLICKNCRLVNGQAPPGTKSLAEMGTWKCMSCGASNGEADEGKRIIKEVLEAQKSDVNTLIPGEEFKDEDDDDDEDIGGAIDVGQDEVGPEGKASGKHSSSGTRRRKSKK